MMDVGNAKQEIEVTREEVEARVQMMLLQADDEIKRSDQAFVFDHENKVGLTYGAAMRRPNIMSMVIVVWGEDAVGIGMGFAKAKWPDKFDVDFGVHLSRMRAVDEAVEYLYRDLNGLDRELGSSWKSGGMLGFLATELDATVWFMRDRLGINSKDPMNRETMPGLDDMLNDVPPVSEEYDPVDCEDCDDYKYCEKYGLTNLMDLIDSLFGEEVT